MSEQGPTTENDAPLGSADNPIVVPVQRAIEANPEPYCKGYGPCLHALTITCRSLGKPCERRVIPPESSAR